MTPPAADPPPAIPLHALLLLSDSALPLGSFAFSSGLESFLAHTRTHASPPETLFATTFLPDSVSAYAATSLPYLLAAHHDPAALPALDDALDATVLCTVARRASVAQGRALLALWERAYAAAAPTSDAAAALRSYAALLRSSGSGSSSSCSTTTALPAAHAHLAPLFGAVSRALQLSAAHAAYVYVLGHVKALVSAAVRAGLLGPYRAQAVLASARVAAVVEAAVRREGGVDVAQAGQRVPAMDLWAGRHEVLYSRIFNS